MFPIGAVLGRRPAISVYRAVEAAELLEFDADTVLGIVAADPVLADFMNRRLQHVLALSVAQARAAYASQALAQQSFESPLTALPRRAPVAVGPGATLHEALALMQARGVGSVLALDEHGPIAGVASALGGTLQMLLGGLLIVVLSQFGHDSAVPMLSGIAGCATGAFILSRLTLRRAAAAGPLPQAAE